MKTHIRQFWKTFYKKSLETRKNDFFRCFSGLNVLFIPYDGGQLVAFRFSSSVSVDKKKIFSNKSRRTELNYVFGDEVEEKEEEYSSDG